MTLARVKVWNPGDVLTAADLNAEFNNILNNSITLISPFTANVNVNNFQLLSARLENVTTTQTAAQIGRVMFNTSANTIDVDDGTFIRHIPGLKSSQMTSTGATSANDGALAKAWVTFSGQVASSQATALAAFNVSTSANALIRNSTGDYTIPWQFQFSNVSGYAVAGMAQGSFGSTASPYVQVVGVSTNTCHIQVVGTSGLYDAPYISLIAFGMQV